MSRCIWDAGFFRLICIDLLLLDAEQREKLQKELAELRYNKAEPLDKAAVYAANELVKTVWKYAPPED